jgi:uncharacterized membrane protein
MTLETILEYPLPLAFLIYLTICSIIIYTKPKQLFDSTGETSESSEFTANKNLWLFFIILAVLIYLCISILVSHVNRTKYLELMK